MNLKISLISILMLSLLVIAIKSDDYVQDIYDSLPENEKTAFISYFLMKEYWSSAAPIPLFDDNSILEYPFMPNLYEKFEELSIPREFSRALTEWVMTDYNVEHHQIPNLALGEVICPPNIDHCIDIGDFGPNCCPM